MNWQQQTEEMFKTWSESQKKMWDNWTEAMKGFGAGPNLEMWEKTVDTWQDMIGNSLNSQQEWAKMWAEGVTKVEGAPTPMVEWAKQAQEMNSQWNEMQKQMWENWFDMLKKIEPGNFPQMNSEESQKMFQAWQETTQKMMKTQSDWVNTMTKAAKTTAKKSK